MALPSGGAEHRIHDVFEQSVEIVASLCAATFALDGGSSLAVSETLR